MGRPSSSPILTCKCDSTAAAEESTPRRILSCAGSFIRIIGGRLPGSQVQAGGGADRRIIRAVLYSGKQRNIIITTFPALLSALIYSVTFFKSHAAADLCRSR